jgi:Mrp family chromosome partitioning ATPase/capsular polysaccharide biosynthesis protein
MPPQTTTITLRDYLEPLVHRWKLILAIIVVITAASVAYNVSRSVSYTASTKVYLGQTNASTEIGVSSVNPESVADQAALLTSSESAAKVAREIGWTGSAEALAGSVSAKALTDTNFLVITATASTSAESAKIANGFAKEFIAENTASSVAALNSQISSLKSQIAALAGPVNVAQREADTTQLRQLQAQASTSVGTATQIDPPTGGSASAKKVLEFGAVAVLGSLIGAILLAFGLERLDPRFKSVAQASDVYRHPVLATVIHDPDIEHFVGGQPALPEKTRESFRQLRLALDLAAGEQPHEMIVVTSAVPSEGKSTVARNLALVLAESGRKTLLIDADLRRPRLAKSLGLEPGAGLSHLLSGGRNLAAVTVHLEVNAGDGLASPGPADRRGEMAVGFAQTAQLDFIPAGGHVPNPPVALGSDTAVRLLAELRSTYDVVVIDTTPLVAVSDAVPLIRQADAVLLVARASTDARSARRASQLIEAIPDANVVGLVINDVPSPQAAAYGYGSGYGYGYHYRSAEKASSQ